MVDRVIMQEWLVEIVVGVICGLCTSLIGGLVWGLRLEGIVKILARDVARVEVEHNKLADKHDSLDQKIMEKFSEVCEGLARIEEKLKSKQNRNRDLE